MKYLLSTSVLLSISLFDTVVVAENEPDLSSFGYDSTWSNAEIGYLRTFNVDAFDGTVYENVTSAEECAQKCSDDGKPGGSWVSLSMDLGGGQCACQSTIECKESCVVFAYRSFKVQ